MKMLIFAVSCALLYPLEPTEVLLAPSDPTDDDDLVASVPDADDPHDQGGAIEGYRVAWTRDGVERDDLADAFTVPESETSTGETWVVTIFAFRGDEQSDPGTAAVVIGP